MFNEIAHYLKFFMFFPGVTITNVKMMMSSWKFWTIFSKGWFKSCLRAWLLNLIKKHFLKTNKFRKIFIKSTVKTSCIKSIFSIVSRQSKNLLNPTVTQNGCNCRIREDCPLQNQCLKQNIIYRADVRCEPSNYYKFYME